MDGTGFSAQMLRANLIRFASLLFNKMSNKYGGDTTLNELVIMNYGFVCHVRGEDIRCLSTKLSHPLISRGCDGDFSP